MSIIIKEVNDKATLKRFVTFNLKLYKGNPYHVPALIDDELMTLDREKNPAFEFCESIYYLAYRNSEIVGRIAGIINHRANETWNQKYARFSFIDFIDDEEVSKALFAAVENWALEKGMNGIQGPLGFTDLDHEGLLVWGFDQRGTMATTYSFPYYKEHLAKLGYVKDQDWQEFHIQISSEIPEKFKRISEIVLKKYGLKIKKFNKTKEIWPYAEKIFQLWNEAYKPLYGYSELSPRQIEYYIKMYIPMLRLEMITLVVREADDAVVGLAITLPSLSKALQKAKGSFFPFGWIYLLKALYGKGDVVDLYIMGVLPEYQNKGVNALIFYDLIPILNKIGFSYAETNPELEVNFKMQSQWEDFESKHVRTRRAFIKHLKTESNSDK
jgi:GNAT superfamily N-acetyltransferase